MSLHGFTPPVPDGETLTAADCPDCGLPTFLGEHYGMPYGPVRLDAMPVVVWEQLAQFGASVRQHQFGGPSLYTEHVCPLDLTGNDGEGSR